MENTIVSVGRSINKRSIIGFLLMLVGPAVLFLAGFISYIFGYFPEIVANIIAWGAFILPGIGVVFSIISLCNWKRAGHLSRALSIVTVVICNPLFYYLYFFVCGISSNTLAGLSWM